MYKQYLPSPSTNSEADCPVTSNKFSSSMDEKRKKTGKSRTGEEKETDSVRKITGRGEQKNQKVRKRCFKVYR